MTNWGFENSDEQNQGNNTASEGPKALRDAYEKQKAQIDELTQKVTAFMEAEQKRQLSTVFDALGVPGAHEHYKGDADPEKAKAWVESMRGVFGGAAPEAAAQSAAPALPPSMQAQFERMSQAGQDGVPAGTVEAAHAAVNDAGDLNALLATMKQVQR